MRTNALHHGLAAARPAAAAAGLIERVRAALGRFAAGFIAAQERRARNHVGPYLARQDDATLSAAGFSADEIAALRRDFRR